MKKGFTLAEVLITLAIIGVVAAITLPTLMQDGKVQQLGSKLAKFQSNLEKVTRGYAIEADLTKDDVATALLEELLFSDNSSSATDSLSGLSKLNDNVAYTLRDGTQITVAPNGINPSINGSYYLADSKLGEELVVVKFNPNIPGLDGPKDFEFLVTTRGYVVPNATDTCLQQIARKNYKATTVYNRNNCTWYN